MSSPIKPNDILPQPYNSGWGHNEYKSSGLGIKNSEVDREKFPHYQFDTVPYTLYDSSAGNNFTFESIENLLSDLPNLNNPPVYTLEKKEVGDGPFKNAFEASTEGVIRQELITYKMRDGIMIKEVNVRKYTPNDYIDSKDVIPLGEIKT